MRPEQWRTFKRAARGEPLGRPPVALIADSPWIPGYAGISHLRYYTDPDLWFESNLRIMEEFPDVIFVPSWWIEYGMAIEPGTLGSRISFHPDQPPSQMPVLERPGDIGRFPPVNPYADGLMALALENYRIQKPRIFGAGYTLSLATARGPLCLAAFLRGLTEFLTDIVEDPEGAAKLLAFTTDTVIQWLKAQAEVIGDTVEGIFVLDDIPGLLSRRSYQQFAHPYLKQICDAFPPEWVKIYHNDANTRPFLADLAATGFDVLNWTHNIDVREAREKTGGKLCLMGNVAPLGVAARGTPEEVRAAALDILRKDTGPGLILSLGGGISPGTPKANIDALLEAVRS